MRRPIPVAAAVALLALVATAAPAETISQIKRFLDWTPVATSGVVTYLTSQDCYIESPDRCAAIWVQAHMTAIEPGDHVQVAGVLSTVDGERVICEASVYPDGASIPIWPLAMACKWIGGSWFGYQDCAWDVRLVRVQQGYQWRWVPASGLNNTGLLVTTVGTVTAAYTLPSAGVQWFYIDDGSKATADLGEDGILVEYAADVEQGDLVSVTGISSVEGTLDDGWRVIRAIRPRSSEDIRVLGEAEQTESCSPGEFD